MVHFRCKTWKLCSLSCRRSACGLLQSSGFAGCARPRRRERRWRFHNGSWTSIALKTETTWPSCWCVAIGTRLGAGHQLNIQLNNIYLYILEVYGNNDFHCVIHFPPKLNCSLGIFWQNPLGRTSSFPSWKSLSKRRVALRSQSKKSGCRRRRWKTIMVGQRPWVACADVGVDATRAQLPAHQRFYSIQGKYITHSSYMYYDFGFIWGREWLEQKPRVPWRKTLTRGVAGRAGGLVTCTYCNIYIYTIYIIKYFERHEKKYIYMVLHQDLNCWTGQYIYTSDVPINSACTLCL